MATVSSPPAQTAAGKYLRDALHLATLFSFAVAQPIYDRLSAQSAFLVDQGIRPLTLVVLTLIVSVMIPAVVILSANLLRRFSLMAYRATYCSFGTMFVFLLLIPLWNRATFLYWIWKLVGACITTALAVRLYLTSATTRRALTYASVGIVAFPVWLLSTSPVINWSLTGLPTRSANWKPVPIVVLVLDEFSTGTMLTPDLNIDAQRFPNLAALARGTTWFRNASGVASDTNFAVPCLLTGRHQTIAVVSSHRTHPENLLFSLSATGDYDVAAFEPVSAMAPRHLTYEEMPEDDLSSQLSLLANILAKVYLYNITPPYFQNRLPHIPRIWFGMHAEPKNMVERPRGLFRYEWGTNRDRQFSHFLKCIDNSPKPTVYFMHVLLPHVPWCYLPDGRRHSADDNEWQLLNLTTHGDGNAWGADDLAVQHCQQRYLLQAMYVDHLIGQLIERLKQTGIYDECLLVVTADHGLSFRTNLPRRVLATENRNDILPVPLFIKRPGQTQGQIDDRAVESVDIFPTIAAEIGMDLHRPVDGRPLFSETWQPRTYRQVFDGVHSLRIPADEVSPRGMALELNQRFGNGSNPDGLYRIGPDLDLIGRNIEQLQILPQGDVKLTTPQFPTTLSDDPRAIVPCYFEGKIAAPLPVVTPVRLAVAVNGTIRATTRTYTDPGFLNQWQALIPDSCLQHGQNDIRFYSVTGTAPHWQLAPCTIRVVPPQKIVD